MAWRDSDSSRLCRKFALTVADSNPRPRCVAELNRRWERASIRIFTYLSLCQACNWPRKWRRSTRARASERVGSRYGWVKSKNSKQLANLSDHHLTRKIFSYMTASYMQLRVSYQRHHNSVRAVSSFKTRSRIRLVLYPVKCYFCLDDESKSRG